MLKDNFRTANYFVFLNDCYSLADLCLYFVFSPFQIPSALNKVTEESCFTCGLLYLYIYAYPP